MQVVLSCINQRCLIVTVNQLALSVELKDDDQQYCALMNEKE